MGKILIAGCGYLGTELATSLVRLGREVIGLKRNITSLPPSIVPWSADLQNPLALNSLPNDLTTVFFSAAPTSATEQTYRETYLEGFGNLLTALERTKLERLFFCSSTSVYGQSAGEWIDELSPTVPPSFTGKVMLEAEQLAKQAQFPTTVVRFGGIYGPGRDRLLNRIEEGLEPIPTVERYTNLIHRDDCVGVLIHLMNERVDENLFLAVDDEPVSRVVLLEWLAYALEVKLRPSISLTAPPSERHLANKRCSNARLRAAGYQFRYPTFRDGYRSLLVERKTVKQTSDRVSSNL